MKILSLNINNFGGTKPKPVPSDCRKINSNETDWELWKKRVDDWRKDIDGEYNAEKIKNYIKENEFDIVIIQEFDMNSKNGNLLINGLEAFHYNIVYPNGYEAECKRGNKSITVMFIKDIDSCQISRENFSVTKRSVEIKFHGYTIIGVHVPLGDKNFWNSIIRRYKDNENEKLLLIGDMNVFDFGTLQKEKFFELLKCGAVDAWVQKKNSMDRPTANTGKRIDYAIMTPLLYNDLVDIDIDDILRNEAITDHSAISIIV